MKVRTTSAQPLSGPVTGWVYLGVAVGMGLFALALGGYAQQRTTEPAPAMSSEWIRMMEGLKQAKPMPQPATGVKPEAMTPSGDLVGFDPSNGQVTRFPSAKTNATSLSVKSEAGNPGADPESADGKARVIVGDGPEALEGMQSANKGIIPLITPTPPSPLRQPYLAQPFKTHFKLLLRFRVPIPNNPDRFFVCSATSGWSFHLLSAGHCIYNHDPLEDGSGRGAGYAAEIWAWPSQTDDIDPLGIPNKWEDLPWGVAKATHWLTYSGWINSRDLNWDFAFITLDRRVGDRTGWMARKWDDAPFVQTMYYSGYPNEQPYVADVNPYQYPGGNLGNVIGFTPPGSLEPQRVKLSAYTYGGHDGGAVYRCCLGPDYIFLGVNSTSDRRGKAEATLYTYKTFTDFQNIRNNDYAKRPPVDRAQLIEYVFDNYSKGIGVLSVAVGEQFDLVLNAFNAGYAPSGDITAHVYLTKTYDVSEGFFAGVVSLGSLDPNKHTVQYKTLPLPTYVPPGNYFVGWTLQGTAAQYNTDNKTALITKRQLRVVGLSSVAATPNSVVGGLSATGTVQLSGPAPQIGLGDGTDVLLSSNNAAVQVVNSVHFNEGVSSATFNITTSPVSQNTTAIITTNLNGVIKTTSILVKPTAQPATLNSLALAPASMVGGNTSTATVSLTGPAPANGITVNLSSSNAKAVVPASVLITAGSSSATFPVTTSAVTAPALSTIKASYGGISRAATLSIKPVQPTAISLSPSTLKGGAKSVATITTNGPAPAGGATISLISSNTRATVPKTVQVAAGSSSVTFTVNTSAVTATTTASIKATSYGVSKQAALTIKP